MNRATLAILALLALGAAAAIWAVTSPPALQEGATAPAPSGKATEGGPIVKVALPAELSADTQIGKRAFEAKCVRCHGKNSTGNDGAGPPLVHKVYEPNNHGDAAFLVAVKSGVRQYHWDFGNMLPVDGLTDGEV